MLRSYLRPLRLRIIVNTAVKMLGTLMEVALPAILAFVVNTLVPARDKRGIVIWGIAMIFISFAAWVSNFKANRMAARSAATVVYQIRKDLFEKCMELSATQIDEFTVSSLESRLTSDTYNLHRVLGMTLRMGLRSLMLFLGGVLVCFWLSPLLALILLLLLPPLLLTVRQIFKKAFPLFRKIRLLFDDMVQVIRENIRGIKVSKALDKTVYEQGRFAEHNDRVIETETKAMKRMALVGPSINSILYSGLTLVLIVGAFLANEGLTQPGTIMAFLTYFIQIAMSLLTLNRMFNMYTLASSSWDRIKEVLEAPGEKEREPEEGFLELPEASPEVPEIEFRNVSFSYMKKRNDLEAISFKLYPGETLGIMGATGSGKSTIIRLILRQYAADAGEILIRGKDIRRLRRRDLYPLFGLALQNDFLFAGDIRTNIDFGRGLDDAAIHEAAAHAQASEFIDDKEGGLDFRLASKGVNLSGGQKQRLLLSRALAAKPPVLILDDAVSALDFGTEARFRKVLAEHYSGQSLLIVAQRVASVRKADRTLFLDKGRILAYGDHDELMKTCPPYQEMAKMQMGADEKDEAGARTEDFAGAGGRDIEAEAWV